MADQPKTADDVKALVEERDIRFVRFWFTDILGQLKSFSINAEELDDAFEGGMGFDGSSITGFNAIEESDMIAMPDASTFAVLPWRPEDKGVARMFCDVRHPQPRALRGRPAPRAAARARARRGHGLRPTSTSGPSWSSSTSATPARRAASPEILDEGGYFDLTTLDAGSDVRRETVLALEQLGIHVEYTHHEVGPSQHEIDMRYADALKMADDCMTYRITVKEYAMKYGWHATFMPKPLFGENGSGMHTHQSLFKDGRATPSTTPTTSTSSRTSARPSSPASSSTRARSRRCSPSGSTPTSGSCPATRRRSTAPGRGATARRSCGCRSTTPARSRPRAWSCAAPTPRATPT